MAAERYAWTGCAAGPLLLFHPVLCTPSCTSDAGNLTALVPRFGAANAALLDISMGIVAAKDRFVRKADLGVPLLADQTSAVLSAYDP